MARSEDKAKEMTARYVEKRKTLEKLLKVVNEITQGKTESTACKDNGINLIAFRRFMDKNYRIDETTITIDVKELPYDIGWEEKFLKDLLRQSNIYVMDDFDECFEEIIKIAKNHDDRAAELIVKHYKNEITYRDLGNMYGISYTRCQQIVRDELRRLRRPNIIDMFIHGHEYYILNNQYEKLINERSEKMSEIRSKILEVETQNKDCDEYLKDNGITAYNIEEVRAKIAKYSCSISDIKIEDIGLSARAERCLYYNGIITLGDLIYYTVEEIRMFRNLGNKSAEEIIEKAKEYGIILGHGTEFLSLDPKLKEIDTTKLIRRPPNDVVPLEHLHLSKHATDLLTRNNILSMNALIISSCTSIRKIRGMSNKYYSEIILALAGIGYYPERD